MESRDSDQQVDLGMGHRFVYSVYPDEPRAARAAQLLVEAGFQPMQVHVGVRREGRLREAHPGHMQTLGAAMLIGASLSAAVGDLLVTSAAVGLTSFPLGPLAGLSALTASVLALAPMALPGALLGWLVGALRLRSEPAFPVRDATIRTFVGVEVSPGNRADAEITLVDARSRLVAHSDDWRALAQAALQAPQPGQA